MLSFNARIRASEAEKKESKQTKFNCGGQKTRSSLHIIIAWHRLEASKMNTDQKQISERRNTDLGSNRKEKAPQPEKPASGLMTKERGRVALAALTHYSRGDCGECTN